MYPLVHEVKVLQQDVHPYLPSGGSQHNIGMNQPPTHMVVDNPNVHGSSIGMQPVETRYSGHFQSAYEGDINQGAGPFESQTRNSIHHGDSRAEESLLAKDRTISQLQDEKRRLEADLDEIKVESAFNLREEPTRAK